jgi:hypothetical protein
MESPYSRGEEHRLIDKGNLFKRTGYFFYTHFSEYFIKWVEKPKNVQYNKNIYFQINNTISYLEIER